jgi:membrane-associated protease RseP (regulator of RpoE activity)
MSSTRVRAVRAAVVAGVLVAAAAAPLAAQQRDTVVWVDSIERVMSDQRRVLEQMRGQERRALIEATRRAFAVRRLATMCEEPPAPSGWLGLSFANPSFVQVLRENDAPPVVQYRYDGPIGVVDVAPNSPAARAGIRVRDTIVALAGEPVAGRTIDFGALLVPGKPLTLRVRRDGRERTVRADIVARPDSMRLECRSLEIASVGPGPNPLLELRDTPDGVVFVGRGDGRPSERATRAARTARGGRPERVRVPVAEPAVPVAPDAPDVPAPPPPVVWMMDRTGVAGAELRALSRDLAELVGTERGVFVVSVAPGTPASAAGLRGGDVIVKAAGRDVDTPRDVRRAMAGAEQSLPLDVVRKGKRVALTVKW